MLDPIMMLSFFEEVKLAGAPAKAKGLTKGVKAALGLTALGGIGAGAIGEQAKDDLVMGRQMRKQQGMP